MIDDETGTVRKPRALLPWMLAVGILAFAIGMLLSPWFEENVRSRLPGAFNQPDVGAIAARQDREAQSLDALEVRVTALEARPASAAVTPGGGPPALNDQLAAGTALGAGAARPAQLEARIDALDRGAQAAGTRIENLAAELASLNVRMAAVGDNAAASIESAATSADKARGVLLVTAARRAAEQGQSLAVLEPALRRQFGAENADAVDKLLTASRAAPTLDGLRQRFSRLRPALLSNAPPSAGAGWWARFQSGIADIVQIRQSDSTASVNSARLAEMSARLQRGDVSGALLVLRRLPAPMQRGARDWRLDAEAYATTYGALQQLEAAVLLDDADLPLTAADEGPPAGPTL